MGLRLIRFMKRIENWKSFKNLFTVPIQENYTRFDNRSGELNHQSFRYLLARILPPSTCPTDYKEFCGSIHALEMIKMNVSLLTFR